MNRRRGAKNELVTIYWRDIPAQLKASVAGERASTPLPPRFQHAIDRAATVADKTDTDDYVAQWRRVARPITGSAAIEVDAERELIETAYPRDRLEALVWAGGIDEHCPPGGSND